ncbi:type III secretion system inner membrane ring lipoprotein SctJ [Cupriavidus sp. SS-3]|uniref:type III secretion system inner membrane ring lipoprotein SctJ n=1 Tax=Cupriavidus sp. SS-3 TaxID=3109596 RepID=UPI002DBCDCF7|nr:type III secretion inner membrane ring lipoprotein SctJ [Cupriavidus sp. SS-3]MEC3766939.1 type III secretion inner membrane ring lipoprotein SctJ [Cupriavidus sp. SS-3]
MMSTPPLRRRLARAARLAPALMALALAACKVDLYASLNEPEANQVLAALTAEGIDAEKARAETSGGTGEGQWRVRVEESQLPAALEILRSEGLPGERFASLGQVFQKQGLVATPTEERMRYIFALSQELSETLRNIDGVVTARVHVVIPATDPLSDKIRPSSAAVFIKHRADTDLRLLVPTVKDMVAHSIEGVTHDNVSLSLVEARPFAPQAGAPGPAPGFAVGRFAAIAVGAAVAIALAVAAVVAWQRGVLRWPQRRGTPRSAN